MIVDVLMKVYFVELIILIYEFGHFNMSACILLNFLLKVLLLMEVSVENVTFEDVKVAFLHKLE